MKIMALVALGLALMGGAAIAQPQNGNHNHGGPCWSRSGWPRR